MLLNNFKLSIPLCSWRLNGTLHFHSEISFFQIKIVCLYYQLIVIIHILAYLEKLSLLQYCPNLHLIINFPDLFSYIFSIIKFKCVFVLQCILCSYYVDDRSSCIMTQTIILLFNKYLT